MDNTRGLHMKSEPDVNVQIRAPQWVKEAIDELAETRGCTKGDVLVDMVTAAGQGDLASAHPAYEAMITAAAGHIHGLDTVLRGIVEAAETTAEGVRADAAKQVADLRALKDEAQQEVARLRGLEAEAADARRSADELRAALGDKSKRIEELEAKMEEAKEAIAEAKDAKLEAAATKEEAADAVLTRERAAGEAERLKVRCEDLQGHIDMLMGQISMKDEQIKALAAR